MPQNSLQFIFLVSCRGVRPFLELHISLVPLAVADVLLTYFVKWEECIAAFSVVCVCLMRSGGLYRRAGLTSLKQLYLRVGPDWSEPIPPCTVVLIRTYSHFWRNLFNFSFKVHKLFVVFCIHYYIHFFCVFRSSWFFSRRSFIRTKHGNNKGFTLYQSELTIIMWLCTAVRLVVSPRGPAAN